MAQDLTKMQDIKYSELNLWRQYVNFIKAQDLQSAQNFINQNPNLKYKVFNAFNWNRLINAINDGTSTTQPTTDSILGQWNYDYNKLKTASANFKYVGEWEIGIEYKKNNLVTLNGQSYFCYEDHLSSGSNQPPNLTFWRYAQQMKPSLGIQVSESVPTTIEINDIWFDENPRWSNKSWDGLSNFEGQYVWSDGDNTYYSGLYGSEQYVLNKVSSTWEEKTWNINIQGNDIWTDGDNIYYSYLTDQYVLNKETSTWAPKTWNGLSSLNGDGVWTDGNNIYYSDGGSSYQYVLNKETSTWAPKTWNIDLLTGQNIWTDGDNIYCSAITGNYIYNKETGLWSEKVWIGVPYFWGADVWSDGVNTYISSTFGNGQQRVYNKANDTWDSADWAEKIYGRNIWLEGNNIYYSNGEIQYKFNFYN